MSKKRYVSILGATAIAICVLLMCIAQSIWWPIGGTQVTSSAVLAVPETPRLANLVDVKDDVHWSSGSLSTISGGAYSVDNPYKIASKGDLIRMAYLVNEVGGTWRNASYRLTNHINLVDVNCVNWEPIGTKANPFSGVLDGNGFTIYGLTIMDLSSTANEYAGLFVPTCESSRGYRH